MPKKGKKGKKGKKADTGPEIRTTRVMISERARMNCPRMGDNYTRIMEVDSILEVILKNIKDLLALN
jgi:hypothetical protein